MTYAEFKNTLNKEIGRCQIASKQAMDDNKYNIYAEHCHRIQALEWVLYILKQDEEKQAKEKKKK